ncbi:MAG: type IV conjugative transfer system protein TraL [Burkholderiales bacterium]|nr:type IV conjugative transfer system protein TraL [Burkholderiales bacterium]
MKCYYAPQYINKNNILWWESDEVKFVISPLIIFGFFMNAFMFGLILSVVIGIMFIKLRRNKPEGYLKHMMYFNTPRKKNISKFKLLFSREKAFPDSNIRHITG